MIRRSLLLGKVCVACLLASSLYAASACRQPVEGCLDFRALSVAVGADDPCDNCCVYPSLQLTLLPTRNDAAADTVLQVLTRGTGYVRGPGDTVVFDRLVFYLSDLRLLTADGEEVPLLDTFGFRQNLADPIVQQEDGLLRFAPYQTPRISTGRLLAEATFVGLRGNFGIGETYASARAAALNRNARFVLGQDSGIYDFSAERFRSAFLRRSSTLTGIDSVVVEGGTLQPFQVDFPQEFLLPRSYNLNLVLGLPVEALLEFESGAIPADRFVAVLLQNVVVASNSLGR